MTPEAIHKIETLIEEAFRLDTPEKIDTFKRRATSKNKKPFDKLINRLDMDEDKGIKHALIAGGGLGSMAGAGLAMSGKIPAGLAAMSVSPLATLAGTSLYNGTIGAMGAGAAAAAAPLIHAGYHTIKNKNQGNEINKRIVNSIKKGQ